MNKQTGRVDNDYKSKGRLLSFIIAEAERTFTLIKEGYLLYLPSWVTPDETPFGKDDKGLNRIKVYCILILLTCAIMLACALLMLWLGPATYFLSLSKYYIGIGITALLAAGYIITERKPMSVYLQRFTPNKRPGKTLLFYIDTTPKVIIMISPFVLELILNFSYRFAGLIFYFLFIVNLYSFMIMFIYLIVRLQARGHSEGKPGPS